MKKEIIIPRKKSTSIKGVLWMLFSLMIIIFINVCYFVDIPWITSDPPPVFLIIMSLVILPVIIFCLVDYFKQIFNNEPVLIINEQGIHERMNKHSVGLIKWEDIKNITIIPYMGGIYWIGIILRQPEIYITNPKLLKKLQKQKSVNKWGHIGITSIYFEKEIKDVVEIMKYYFAMYNDITDMNT